MTRNSSAALSKTWSDSVKEAAPCPLAIDLKVGLAPLGGMLIQCMRIYACSRVRWVDPELGLRGRVRRQQRDISHLFSMLRGAKSVETLNENALPHMAFAARVATPMSSRSSTVDARCYKCVRGRPDGVGIKAKLVVKR